MAKSSKGTIRRRPWRTVAVAGGLLATASLALGWFGPLAASRNGPVVSTFQVARGPLTISITESGTVRAREQVMISSEVEGRSTIIAIVEEGTLAKEGDLLVELDRSQLEDQKVEQEILLLNAEAAMIRAQEQLAVAKSQAESDVARAELTLAFAEQDLRKYVEGDYTQQLKERQQRITLAREEVTRAEDRLEGSKRLFEERYISQTELNSDSLALMRMELDLDMAEQELKLFETYTHPRQLRLLESDLEQATMELERVKRRTRSDVVQAEADLRAKQSEFTQQTNRLSRLEEQITKCRIYAPTSGMVVYATSMQSGRGNTEPLEAGQEVRERQELIYLPTTGAMMVELKVHESSLEKVRVGQRVRVEVDAVPGKVYWGRITRIAPLPDAQSVWMNPDLTVFATDVALEGSDEDVRTGMTCRAEIIVEQHRDALYVPVQAVVRLDGRPTVYVYDGQQSRPRPVQIGMDNNRLVHLLDGVNVGERVLLTPPLTTAAPLAMDDDDDALDTPAAAERAPDSSIEGEPQASGQPAAAAGSAPGFAASGQDQPPQPNPEQREAMPRQFENMTPEQREAMRRQFESMTPEQREAMRRQFESMTPEQREAMRAQRRAREQN